MLDKLITKNSGEDPILRWHYIASHLILRTHLTLAFGFRLLSDIADHVPSGVEGICYNFILRLQKAGG